VSARASIVLVLIAAARFAHADASTPSAARGDVARPSRPATPPTRPLIAHDALYSLEAKARRAGGGWELVLTLGRTSVIDRESFTRDDPPPLVADFPHQWQCEYESARLDGHWRNTHEFVATVPLTAARTRLMIGLSFGYCTMRFAAVDADMSGAAPRVRVEYASGVP
jgi:hypothetical protein